MQAGLTTDLEAAYRFLQTHDKTAPPMLIIPVRGPSGELGFAILLEGYFLNRETAAAAVAALPPSLASEAKILFGLNRNRAYFR